MSAGFKQALLLLAGLTLVVLGLVWFWRSFEKVPVEELIGLRGEARRNPYLAAERFLARLHLRVESLDNLHQRPELPEPDATLVVPVWRSTLGQERHRRLRAFVERGGHLIVVGRLGREPEAARRPDPLLGELGVEVRVPEEEPEVDVEDELVESDEASDADEPWLEEEDADADESFDDPVDEAPAEVRPPPAPEPEAGRRVRSRRNLDGLLAELFGGSLAGEPKPVRLPGREEPLWVTAERGEEEWELIDREGRAVWAVPGEQDYRIVQLEVGAGLLTVLRSAAFMTNTHIGKDDNAELLWHLATWGGRRGPVVWVVGYEVPSLWALIVRHGWMVLAAAGLWFTLWLARQVRRFGPVHPAPPLARRSLLEHIDAAGAFFWRHHLSRHLLTNLREQVVRRAASRTPEWSRLDEKARRDRLAELCALPPAEVEAAMSPTAPNQRQPFTELVQRLERMMRKT